MSFFGIVGSFSLSLLLGLAVIAGARRFNLGADSAPGVQRFHTHWVPRLGGVPIFVAFSLWAVVSDKGGGWLWVACLFPAFAAGLLEDLTHKVGSWPRLLVTMCGAAVAWFVLGAQIHRLALPVVDGWLALPFVSLVFTAFAVAGGAHALNIIDGYNGLASSFVMVALFAIMIVAGRVQDFELVYLSGGAIAATLGFFVINFPRGRMFLGDGGAYTLGTLLGLLLVALVARHPEVSPWFALTLLAYPVWETLFSIYRKKVLRGTSPMQPDGIHLHMLLYKRLVRSNREGAAHSARILMNSATTLYAIVLSTVMAAFALTFWESSAALFAAFGLFAAAYVALYFSLVRFRAPRGLSMRAVWDRSAIRVPTTVGSVQRSLRNQRGRVRAKAHAMIADPEEPGAEPS